MTDQPLKIAFMGTPDFAAVALQALIDSDHDVLCVYSQPPRPKGRGHKLQKSPVHLLADEHDISVFTPKSLKSHEAKDEFAAHNIDIAIVAAYGLILPKAVLAAPKHGCLNIHASLLPRWRGASPIQHAIWKGDDVTGVTIMQMDEGLDTGDMIATVEVSLDDDMTAAQLHDVLADKGASLTLEVLNDIEGISTEAQDNDLSIYAPLLKKLDGVVDWKQSAIEIDRQVRALNPWPGVWAEIGERRFKILETRVSSATTNTLRKDGIMPCGSGTALQILKIQPEGKKPMDFSSAVNGGYIEL